MPEEYSVEKFYTRSRDRSRNHASYRVNIPEELSGEIAAMIASGKIPEYKTAGDFIRDAVVHRLKWVSDNLPSLNLEQAIQWQMSMDNIAKAKQKRDIEEASVNSCKDLIRQSRDSTRDLERVLGQVRNIAEQLSWEDLKEDLERELERYG